MVVGEPLGAGRAEPVDRYGAFPRLTGRRQLPPVIRGGDLAKSMSRYLIDELERRPQVELMTHEPFFLETSRPGMFAVGDVRSGSIKRVASGVGEGSMAVRLVHQRLAAA